ncbi:hypothetical protein HYH02_003036 [Chlamydomonas schloesseri]|uniref:Protein kinase domain-containing protein n=1 Tax=Chlamydomonas schloesseri TaxID=2026947 RepID=A0A835WSU0_9CHLO|nr:hypothetical protein HYH02_003036 [Chlamydomonas schloesseri]|eukprot:KAG2452807.1 hypothetical protein HYH02_003036 [Chlamydomonas schloesseri]
MLSSAVHGALVDALEEQLVPGKPPSFGNASSASTKGKYAPPESVEEWTHVDAAVEGEASDSGSSQPLPPPPPQQQQQDHEVHLPAPLTLHLASQLGHGWDCVVTSAALCGDLRALSCMVVEPVAGGRPLSDYYRQQRPFPDHVRAAALEALSRVHAVGSHRAAAGGQRQRWCMLPARRQSATSAWRTCCWWSSRTAERQAQSEEVSAAAGADRPLEAEVVEAAAAAKVKEAEAGGASNVAAATAAAPTANVGCVLMDFGASRLDGTAEEQAEELEELRLLLDVHSWV